MLSLCCLAKHYFKEHPLSAINMPNNPIEGDATEDTDWNWYWGTYAIATQKSNNGDTVVEVDDTTGFTSSGEIRSLKSSRTDYVDYTGITSTSFTGCTWGNYMGTSYINYINTDYEVFQLKTGNWVSDTTDVKVGNNSMKYTHDNTGSRVLVMANAKMTTSSQVTAARRNFYCAEKLGFWIKVSNSNIVIEGVETRDNYNTSSDIYRYGKEITVGTAVGSTDWVWKEFDFRDLGLGIKRSSRDWQHVVDSFIIKFSNVSNGDIIKLDGVKWFIENPNPREVKPNVYLFPIGIYNYQIQTTDFYFWDYGHNVIFNMPIDSAFYHYQKTYNSHIKFGYEGEAYPTDKNPQGEVIFWNTWSSGYINFWFLGDSSHPELYEFKADGVHFMSASSTLDGMYPRLNNFGYDNNEIKNTILEQLGDFFIGSFKVVDNVQVKGNRYTPWGTQPDGATTNNFKVWLNQNYMWIDVGTARHYEIASARNHAGYYWNYGRSYGHKSETETNFVDCKFPSDFFDSDANYTFGWSIFDTYSGGIYNTPHWMKIGNSVQVVVKDSSGNPVASADVVVKDKNGTIVWSGTTNSSGETDRFDTFWRKTYISAGDGSASTHTIYLYNKDNDKDYDWGWATGYTHTYYPFTVTISKTGYQTATWVDNFNQIDSLDGYIVNVCFLTVGEGTIQDIPLTADLKDTSLTVSIKDTNLIATMEDEHL